MTLKLYFSPGSSSMAAHIALHEVGVPFDREQVVLGETGTRQPGFLALNPEGKVPVLLVDGRPLTEVAAILFYLASRYPEAKLLPDDAEARAQAISWMSFVAATIHPARRQGIEYARTVYELADRRLGAHTWAVGAYSVADIHLFRLFWRFGRSLENSESAFPRLSAHYDRMMQRPAVRKTIEVEEAIGYALPR